MTRALLVAAGRIVAADVEVAASWRRRLVGWMGRSHLPDAAGLWLPGVRAVHTLGLGTAIDVAFVGPDGRLLALRRRLPPWRVAWGPRGTAATLELAPGALARAGLRAGDQVRLVPTPAGGC